MKTLKDKMLSIMKEKYNMTQFYKMALVIWDALSINISSLLAIWVRFNMHISDIEVWYLDYVKAAALINTIMTLLIFALFRLYTIL